MRKRPMILLVASLLAAQANAQTAPLEWVSFPSGQESLRAALFMPPGAGPHPAVIALHGCGGLVVKGPRVRDWVKTLTGAGYAVLFPDSFGSRGLKSQCNVRKRTVRATRERVEARAKTRDAERRLRCGHCILSWMPV